MFDPYVCLARLFATRTSLRILLAFTLAWVIIALGLSGWEYQNTPGDIQLVRWGKGVSYGASNWDAFCQNTPYVYLSPFAFTFQQFNVTRTSSGASQLSSTVLLTTSTKTKCGWPAQNSSLRLTICVFSVLFLLALFFPTRLSVFARSIFGLFSFLFFVSFVLDSNSSYVGLAECQTTFSNTKFGQDLNAAGVIPACIQSDYSGLAFIDFLIFFLLGLLNTAWGLCKEPYSPRSGESELNTTKRGEYSVDESQSNAAEGDDNTL